MVNSTIIEIQGLAYEYGGGIVSNPVRAIENVSFTVTEGEFVCILGPSGCGKSTLLKLIAGLAHPTSGEIRVANRIVKEPGRDRGMVFQDYALLPWKTVLGNVELGPKLRGVGKTERRESARRYVEMVGLSGFEDTYPHALSGGMKQRVAVARTLANDPALMLMDEPFGALDALTRSTLQKELVRIWQQTGKTILFVTHSVDEAAFLADRVLVLSPRPSVIQEIVAVQTPRDRRSKEDADIGHLRAVARLASLLGH